MRRAARPLGTLLIAGGVALVAWAGVTWAWGDPFTWLYTQREQSRLAERYERSVEAFGGPTVLVAEGDAADAARRYRRQLDAGDPVGRLRVPRLDLDLVVVEATDVGVLRSRGREEVALQACHPRFFASHRYIVYARPIDR